MNDTKKIFTTNQSKFKLVVYWSHKPCGTPYSVFEMQMNYNRKYINSYDYNGVKGFNVTDHKLALQKLLKKMEIDKAKIIKAFLIMNDYTNRKELTIGKFPKGDISIGDFIQPQFLNPNEKGHVYVHGLPCEPLRIDDMRIQNFDYRKQTKL